MLHRHSHAYIVNGSKQHAVLSKLNPEDRSILEGKDVSTHASRHGGLYHEHEHDEQAAAEEEEKEKQVG